ncbi:UNVERIFIED_CONTAM: hypothetical protein PYX00_000711 [Menopon gallinae]|uniref:Peroxisomal membrane protein 11B n=1 Tax=Menopon gallinae TaxID=328185 RepID=A0AAW2I9M9_9NEOP
MEQYIKLNTQTVGKDKIARLLQYMCRLMWYQIQKRKFNPYTVDKLKSLEYTLSTFRKLLRLGKSVEVLHSALKSIHYEDVAVKLTSTMSKISTAIFLLTDNILWIGRSGLATVDTSKWSQISNKYWLYSILLNLCRDFYEITKLMDEKNIRIRLHGGIDLNIMYKHFMSLGENLITEHKDVFWDTVKNACDVWIPLNALGYTKLTPGFIGMMGTISSIAGLISLINPKARLTPS